MTAHRGPRSIPVLVASGTTWDMGTPGRFDCLDGEVCWVLPPCSDDREGAGCECWREFQGAATGGRTTAVRVEVLRDVDPRSVRAMLRRAAAPLVGAVLAERAATVALDAAARFPTGTFLVRDRAGVRPQFCAEHQRTVDLQRRTAQNRRGAR